MSVDDSQEEDCTVYIEELKSDNPALKLNAAGKIAVIGAVLGHARIKEELIPYLIEIIEQMDNDNEFLIKICEGILELKQFCRSPEELSALIYPLRVLASLDQPPVRDQATNCLKKLAVGQTKDFYEKHYYPLVTSMGKKNGPYSPKVTACCLLPVAYPFVSEKSQAEFRALFRSLALEEGSPLVRRAVAENVEAFANVVDKKVIRSDFYEIWQSLIVDTFDIIRIKALECAVTVARAFKKEETTEKFFKLIRFVDSGKKSWRVRYSLVECLAAVLNYLEKDVIRKDVVEAFEELLKDQEAEVRAIALIKLPELTSKLSPAQSWSVFFQYVEKAARDANKESTPTVKLGVVEAVIPYFRTIEKEKLLEAGMPILGALLKDENQSIRIGVMQKIMDVNEMLDREEIIKHVIPLIEGCLADKKWRFKLAIAEALPSFLKSLSFDDHRDFYEKLVSGFLKDHNFAVREQAIKSIVQAKDTLGYAKYWELSQKYVNTLIADTNYIYRVTAGVFVASLKGIDKSHFSELFSSLCKRILIQARSWRARRSRTCWWPSSWPIPRSRARSTRRPRRSSRRCSPRCARRSRTKMSSTTQPSASNDFNTSARYQLSR